MRRLIAVAGVAGIVACAGAAQAGDGYGSQPWTGFYVGAHAGYGWGEWDGRYATTAGCDGPCPVFDPESHDGKYNIGMADPFQSLSGDGFLGGAQVGFNVQSGVWVLGAAADISGGDLGAGGRRATDPDYSTSTWDKTVDMSLDTFGTVRARLGYANGAVMPYVTGGLAWGQTSGDLAVAYSNAGGYVGTSHASVDETHVGWTVGTGVEWKVGGGFSLKAEYLYADLGGADYNFKGEVYNGDPFETDSFPADLTLHTVRLGLNYQFGD